eukprot:56018-Eustigmatos_ZCMA.PRE.1
MLACARRLRLKPRSSRATFESDCARPTMRSRPATLTSVDGRGAGIRLGAGLVGPICGWVVAVPGVPCV